MIYRPYGKTGKNISVISFGGMRFPEPENLEDSAELLLYAHSKGINYFDTAPLYCDSRSEDIVGHALGQLPRNSFYVSSKCSRPSGDEFRRSLEDSLTRLGVEQIDFFYIWYLLNREDWDQRKRQGDVEAALRAKQEGLIKHLVCSSHMEGESLSDVLAEGIFEGVLIGYNALNFPYRQAAVKKAGQQGLGVVTMNPLGGGLIPQNPERFAFLKTAPEETVVSAALRFNISHPAITSALVVFTSRHEVDDAVAAVQDFIPYSQEQQQRLIANIETTFDGLCTGCGYCLPCPVDIPVPKFMDSYNQLILSHGNLKAVADRFRLHWGLSPDQAAQCTRCGACEKRCTQHLPIIDRFQELIPDNPNAEEGA